MPVTFTNDKMLGKKKTTKMWTDSFKRPELSIDQAFHLRSWDCQTFNRKATQTCKMGTFYITIFFTAQWIRGGFFSNFPWFLDIRHFTWVNRYTTIKKRRKRTFLSKVKWMPNIHRFNFMMFRQRQWTNLIGQLGPVYRFDYFYRSSY